MSQTREEKLELLALLQEKEHRRLTRKLYTYYPVEGQFKRSLYKKHLKFFEAGKTKRERLFMAANRVGKTEGAGGYELTLHLTGEYPDWWNGRRFDRPVETWVAGKTGKTTRDIIQAKLFGSKGKFGQGLIPLNKIHGQPTAKAGVSDAYDTALIKHKSGGFSSIQFKSFDQGRDAYEGTYKDIVWFDEEPPLDVYTEGLLRTMDTTGNDDANGMVMITFTPLEGMSETVLKFLPGAKVEEVEDESKFVVMASWDDVPHLSEKTKKELLKEIQPFQRDARTKGIPALGSGAVYQVPEEDIKVEDFPIPDHWPRVYGLDVGWNRTAAPWGAWDRENDVVYLYAEHYRGQAEPSVHAAAIKAKGDWIPGVIDPAARGRSQVDGRKLMDLYRENGLKLDTAFNGIESGIQEVFERLSQGRLKVFKSMSNWFAEYRLYRRDEKGQIIKSNDHLMDGSRYLIMSGLEKAKVKPAEQKKRRQGGGGSSSSWMG